MEYCSHIWGGAPRSHGFDLLDRVQKQVVSLVGSGFSSGLQALSHRRGVVSLGLFYKYNYGKCSTELADLVPPKHVTVRSTCFSEQTHRPGWLFPGEAASEEGKKSCRKQAMSKKIKKEKIIMLPISCLDFKNTLQYERNLI